MGLGGKMRKGIQFAACLLALLAAQSGLCWADDDHFYSLINASAGRVDFADENGHMAQKGFVTFTILTVLATGNVGYSLSQLSINCNRAEIATLENANYASNGAALPSQPVDSAVQPIATGTLGQALQAVICKGVDPYPRSKAIKSITAAVAKAHGLLAALQVPPAK
jgi:hypothetical protein